VRERERERERATEEANCQENYYYAKGTNE
jgi:hypothetical protein